MTPKIRLTFDLDDKTPRRFWAKVEKLASECGCWLWSGGLNKCGYGTTNINKVSVLAHRLSFVLNVGPISPDRPCILHRCDTPSCVNPDHLFAGTMADNTADRDRKKRQQMGQKNPSAKLTPLAVRVIRRLHPRSSTYKIAKIFNVGHTAIWEVVTGVAWKQV